MAPEFASAPLVAGMDDRARGDVASIACVTDGPAQVVIVGQLVGENGESADLVQNSPTQRDRGAKTGMGHA